jgi:FlaA1/EpsC-like NDP-sugar epimerase
LAMDFHTDSFVMISTDKAVNPSSMMGACKRVAELHVQAMAGRCSTRFVTVRFGNVLDSAGSVVQLFRQQIAAGGPVTVTDPDMRRYFMTIPEASRLVIQAGAIGQSGQILVLDMGEPVHIADLAADMIRLSGLRVGDDVAIEFTGLRPGEKLYEELHVPGERLLPTCHPKIIVADHKPAGVDDLQGAIAELERLAGEAPEAIVDQLQKMVCGYRQGEPRQTPQRRAAA